MEVGHHFMVFIDYMGIFFGEVAKSPTHFKIRLPVFFLLICEKIYVLGVQVLLKICTANTFSHHEARFFILFTKSFNKQMFLILIYSNL